MGAVVKAGPVPERPNVPAQHPMVVALDSDSARAILQPFIPSGVSFDRVLREAYIYATEHPEVMKCTTQSIVRSVAKVLGWGLILGETAHIVPFNVKVSRQGEPDRWETRASALQDYKGKAHLIVKAGAARKLDAKCVYSNEEFRYREGTDPEIVHIPIIDPKARGELIAAYAWAKVTAYDVQIVVMSLAEIDAIRQSHSKQWKKGAVPAWYAKKTCVHQLAKLLPKTPRTAELLSRLDDEEDGEAPAAIRGTDAIARIAAQPDPYTVPADGSPRPTEREPGEEDEMDLDDRRFAHGDGAEG